MKPLRRLLASLLTALAASAGLVVLTALPAEACSCVGGGPAAYTRWPDVVLVGTVTDIEQTNPGAGAVQSSLDPVRYTLEEDRLLKGSVGDADEVVVTSAGDSASCGLDGIKVGTAYVVFASQTRDGGLASGSCAGSGPAGRPTGGAGTEGGAVRGGGSGRWGSPRLGVVRQRRAARAHRWRRGAALAAGRLTRT